jgi:hypothetical protein
MTKPLSPATQTVLDAFLNGYICKPGHNVAFESDRNGLAAALRAAADRVVPEQGCQIYGLTERENERQQVREEILSIAAELEAR